MTAGAQDGGILEPVRWEGDAVAYVDQRRLPHDLVRERAESVEQVVEAIATLAVRGAPCIGMFAAYGVALARGLHAGDDAFARAADRIRAARPTAVNLAWAVDRMLRAQPAGALAEAHAIAEETRLVDAAIARHGAALVPSDCAAITHCNTGPLATGAGGTALGVLIEAHRAGKRLHVYADETRPLLQGARLTMLELAAAGVPATLIVDGAAAAVIGRKGIALAIVGADRIAPTATRPTRSARSASRWRRLPPHPVLRRGAALDDRLRAGVRRRHPDRGARGARGARVRRRRRPDPRAATSPIPRSTSRPGG